MRDAWIVGAVRTPVGRRRGALAGLHPDDLSAAVLKELARRTGVEPREVEDVVWGCVTQTGEQGSNVGRKAVLTAGWPVEVPGRSVNRMCGSGLEAINEAAQAVASGAADLVVAGGVESMSRVPIGSDAGPLSPDLAARFDLVHQGISAEMVGERWGLSRRELDEFSLESHRRAVAAAAEGRFAEEIVSVAAPRPDGGGVVTVTSDEGPRPGAALDKLASLPAAFKADGLITAGNSSQISDGAAGVMVASPAKARELGLRPRARIVATSLAGVDPVIMLTGVIPATARVLKRAGLRLEHMDVIEVNEAFASVVLAWGREVRPDWSRVNPNGGAIALGHPLGASGARILTSMLYELERREGRYGLATLCIGHGMGIATIIERPAQGREVGP